MLISPAKLSVSFQFTSCLFVNFALSWTKLCRIRVVCHFLIELPFRSAYVANCCTRFAGGAMILVCLGGFRSRARQFYLRHHCFRLILLLVILICNVHGCFGFDWFSLLGMYWGLGGTGGALHGLHAQASRLNVVMFVGIDPILGIAR